MELHTKTFRLRVERDAATATLENVLAVVRRGGLGLHSLTMAPGRHGVDVHLRVQAGEPEPLQLCRVRLCNVIGIVKIRELTSDVRQEPGHGPGGHAGATRSDCNVGYAPTAVAARA
ncbi:hypothetical protein GCM10007388_38120 [Pseudoduganella plicata]|uniref:Uncharacterized protein n=2 Tax=Pseudoduganella plicata TaxID=321984 RepID=A0AA88CDN7_9BURK|nr:hypothetical protein GCM10007388_38120 [Pseudoduganella plicata]